MTTDRFQRRVLLKRGLGAVAMAAGAAGAVALLKGCTRELATSARNQGAPERKLVLVQFGGGTRSSETIDDPTHRWIPRLWNEMIPRGALFTNMRVEGKVVHPNSTGSMMTGHWEWADLDWTRPLAHPSIFEIYRKERQARDTEVWAMVYASILALVGESSAAGYGADFAPNVIEPPTIPRSTGEKMDALMAQGAAGGSPDAEHRAATQCARLARADSHIATSGLRSAEARSFLDRQYATWLKRAGTTSHDAFLTDCAIAAMQEFSPAVLAVCFGEIDCAHYGSWSRYTDAIARTDELTWRLWRAVESIESYRGRTLMLVLPDHGRQLETPEGPGFIHHSDFYRDSGADEGCRRVWMLALGGGVYPERQIHHPVPITAVAATAMEYLRLSASLGAAGSVLREICPAPVG